LNQKKLQLEKLINDEHNDLIKKTIKIRELEQKINEVEGKKNKVNSQVCHDKDNIEVRYKFG
jgi:hypothetical protein